MTSPADDFKRNAEVSNAQSKDEKLQRKSEVEDAIDALKSTSKASLFAVSRGGWCRVCGMWFMEWMSIPNISKQLKQLNAHMYHISRDTQKSAEDAARIRGFVDGTPCMTVVGDSDQKWITELRKNWGISLDCFEHEFSREGPTVRSIQPAFFLIVSGELRYKWIQSEISISKESVYHGAFRRQQPKDLWELSKANLLGDTEPSRIPEEVNSKYVFGALLSKRVADCQRECEELGCGFLPRRPRQHNPLRLLTIEEE